MLFEYINTYHFGRCTKQNDWCLKAMGINRIYYIHSGDLTVRLDNKPYQLKKHHIYLFPQNLKFELILTSGTNVDHTFFDFFTLPAIKMDHFIEINPIDESVIKEACTILFHLAEKYHTYPALERNEYTDLIESYLNDFLFLVDRNTPIDCIHDQRINSVLDYIHRHYNESISTDQLASLSNLEKNYFIRLFKKSMNITPYQYIRKYRFNIALTLMKHKYSLSEASLKVGYSDEATFSHEFKKEYGISPSKFLEI